MIQIVKEGLAVYLREGDVFMLKDSSTEMVDFQTVAAAEGYLRAMGAKYSLAFTVEETRDKP